MDAGTAEGQPCVLSPDPKLDPLDNWMHVAGLGYPRMAMGNSPPPPSCLTCGSDGRGGRGFLGLAPVNYSFCHLKQL